MHEVLVNRLGGLSLPRKSVVRLTDRPDMTLDVYRGRKTTMQQQQQKSLPFLKWLRFSCISNMAVCVCVPILVTMFPEWLSGTEPLLHTPGAMGLSSLFL